MKKTLLPVILASVLILSACEKKEEKQISFPPTPAVLIKAKVEDVNSYIATLGTTASSQSVNIVPQVSGQITSINFKQGDVVKKDQILAVIDKRPYQAAVMQAEGQLRQAQSQLKIDQLQLDRNKKLAEDSYVAKQTFDTIVAQVETDKGVVETAKGALETAKINLDWCDIKSPVDGKVGLYNINQGNVVAAGTSVITSIENVDTLYVDFVIPSQRLYDAMKIMERNGGKVDITVSYIEDNFAGRSRKATAGIVLNKMRYETGTAVLRGELENKDRLFWPNQPVSVRVELDPIKGAVLVPDICVQTNDAGPYLYIATPYKGGVFIAKQVQVSKGQLFPGEMRLITEGLKGGEYVVRNMSQLRLQAGPFIYMADKDGMIIGEDGKPITTLEGMMKFMAESTKIADELRGEMMAKQMEAAKVAQAKQAELAAATKAAAEGASNSGAKPESK